MLLRAAASVRNQRRHRAIFLGEILLGHALDVGRGDCLVILIDGERLGVVAEDRLRNAPAVRARPAMVFNWL